MIEDDRLFDLAGLNANALYAQAEEVRAIADELLTARHALGRVEELAESLATKCDSEAYAVFAAIASRIRLAVKGSHDHDKDQH